MTDEPRLFDPGPPAGPPPSAVSAGRLQTMRAKAALSAGRHPANGMATNLAAGTCGTCSHLVHVQAGNTRCLKCPYHRLGMSSSSASDMRASWPACPHHTPTTEGPQQ